MPSHVVRMVKDVGFRMISERGLDAFQLWDFVPWYAHNRIRAMALPFEQNVWGRLDGRAQNPRFLTIKPTFRCNLRCGFCRYVANGQVFGKADYFLDDEWMQLIDDVAPLKPYIAITGGEPLLYPRIGELLARIKHHDLRAAMVTNATLLEKRAEEIMDAPPMSLQVSIDGRGAAHDELRRVEGTFEKAKRGLEKLNALKKERGSALPLVVINSVITGENYSRIADMTRVAHELGADIVNFQHFWFMTAPMLDAHNNAWGDCFPMDEGETGTVSTTNVDTDALWAAMQEAKATAPLPVGFYPELSREELETYYNAPETLIRPRVPGCAWLQTAVFPNGDVSPCFGHIVGNIRETRFEDIWNGTPMRDHRQRLAEHGPYPVCARCCAYFRFD